MHPEDFLVYAAASASRCSEHTALYPQSGPTHQILKHGVCKSDKLLRRSIQLTQHPAFHAPRQGNDIKLGQQVHIRMCGGNTFLIQRSGDGFYGAVDNGIDILIEKLLDMLVPYALDSAQTNLTILLYILEQLQQSVLPEGCTFMPAQEYHRFLFEHPAKQIIDIFKMIIKILPLHAAQLSQFPDGDLFQRLFLHQGFQGIAQGLFGVFRYGVGSFFHWSHSPNYDFCFSIACFLRWKPVNDRILPKNMTAAQNIDKYVNEKNGVMEMVNKLSELVDYKESTHIPYKVAFCWGKFVFKGVVSSLTVSYQLFDRDGNAVQARVSMRIRGKEEKSEKNVISKPFESPDRTKYRNLGPADELWMLAYDEYDDAADWRHIAKENHILNPRKPDRTKMMKLPSI